MEGCYKVTTEFQAPEKTSRRGKGKTEFLEEIFLWKESKKPRELLVKVVGTTDQKRQFMTEFYESNWAGH